MSFWKELKRRNVYKVGVAYVIVAWLLIQAASIIFPHMRLPEWAVPLLIAFLIIGFPLILLFAWAFEITPDGLKWTKEVPLHESITHITGRKLDYILAGLLVIAVGYIAIDKLYIEQRASKTEQESVSVEAKAKKTLAVLPFVNMSPDPDQEYFVDGLTEELLNTLAQIPDLGVTARTSSFTFKGSNKKVQEIASELGVDNVLEGSVRKADNALRITAQLVHATDGLHLWSKTYDRELKDIFAVQEDIATAVAEELSETLGIERYIKQVSRTDNEEAYELYLVSIGQYNDFKPENALETIKAAISLDPEYALAWSLKSNIHNGISAKGVSSDSVAEHNAALQSAMKAIELEPNMAAGYFSLGFTRTCEGNWIDAESAYQKAVELTSDQSQKYKMIHPYHLLSVGNFKKAVEIMEAARHDDPLNRRDRMTYTYTLVLFGDIQQAYEENKRCKVLFGDQWSDLNNEWMAPIGPNALSSSDSKLMQSLRETCLYNLDDEDKKHFGTPKEVLDELQRCSSDPDEKCCDPYTMGFCAAYLGYPELAVKGLEKGIILEASSTWFIWEPLFNEVRQTPRFKELVKKIGLVDYWNKFGWPDICHQLNNGDFECD